MKGDAGARTVGLAATRHMAPHRPHAVPAAPSQPRLTQARLVLGAAAAAVGLIVAIHWIVVPGDHVSLDLKNRRAESVAALNAAAHSSSRPKVPAARSTGTRSTANGLTRGATANGHATKTAPRTAGKPVGSSPATKPPGAPAAGDPATSSGDSPPATETPAVQGTSSSPPPPPPTPPSPPPPPALLPQVPELQQVPVPTVPGLPTPQLPSVPTPPVPKLP